MKKFLSLIFVVLLAMFAVVSCDLIKPECKHENTEVLEGKAATCSEEGLTEGSKCIDCEAIVVEQTVIEKLEHKLVDIAAIEATCTSKGRTAGKKCSVCNAEVVASVEIPMADHKEASMADYEATCLTPGSKGGTYCTVCYADITKAEVIPANGHEEEILPYVSPTCTETGLTEGKKCKVCKAVLIPQESIPANGHKDETIEAVQPTCYSVGHTAGVICSVCQVPIVSTEEIAINPNAHPEGALELSSAATDSTCAVKGHEDAYTCEKCGATVGGAEKELDANAHPAESIVTLTYKESSCSATGLTEGKHCNACNKDTVPQEVIPLKNHDTYEAEKATPSDCKTGTIGYTAHIKCKNCDYEVLPEEIPYAHESNGWITTIEPTETVAGEKQTTCTKCGNVVTEEIPATGVDDPDMDPNGWVAID